MELKNLLESNHWSQPTRTQDWEKLLQTRKMRSKQAFNTIHRNYWLALLLFAIYFISIGAFIFSVDQIDFLVPTFFLITPVLIMLTQVWAQFKEQRKIGLEQDLSKIIESTLEKEQKFTKWIHRFVSIFLICGLIGGFLLGLLYGTGSFDAIFSDSKKALLSGITLALMCVGIQFINIEKIAKSVNPKYYQAIKELKYLLEDLKR